MVIKIVLLACFLSLPLTWQLTSPYRFRGYLKKLWSPRTTIIYLTGLMLLFQIFDILTLKLNAGPLTYVISFAGLTAAIVGTVLAVWAKFVMSNNWGEPAQHNIKRQQELVTDGPFAFSRNPIYLGLLLYLLGFELALQSFLLVIVLPIFWLILYAVKKEEKLLEGYYLLKKHDADAVIPVVQFSYPPQKLLSIQNGFLKILNPSYINNRSQEFKPLFHDAGLFYWLKVKSFLKQKKIFMKKSAPLKISEMESQDINTPADWNLAELKYKIVHHKKFMT